MKEREINSREQGPVCMYLTYKRITRYNAMMKINCLATEKAHSQISINRPFDSMFLVRIFYKIPFWNAPKTIISMKLWWMEKLLRLNVSSWKLHRHQHHSLHKIYEQTGCRMYTTDDDVSVVCMYVYVFGFNLFTVTDAKSIFWVIALENGLVTINFSDTGEFVSVCDWTNSSIKAASSCKGCFSLAGF